MKFWQLGNTSVRSALRIRDGLVALSQSSIQGNIRNVDGDIAFRELLGKCGVVSLGSDATNSVGRKWRSAMGKLGFIYPEVKSNMGFTQEELGPLDIITDAGRNLINAQTVPAIQECYLRYTYSADGNWFDLFSAVLGVGNYVGVRKAERRTVHLLPRDGNDRHYINACRCSDRNCVEPAILAYSA